MSAPGIVRGSMEAMVQPGEVRVQRALLSVSDKTGIVEFARGLASLGVELLSTGGTATALREGGLEVRSVEDFTGFPEIMGGRVKTLHPKIYAGVLALRDNDEHMAAAAEHEVEFVDLVCVNLYPFEQTAARRGATEHEVIENIDIGGPTMIRAAAKNFAFTRGRGQPRELRRGAAELKDAGGKLSLGTRESLAAEAFSYTARYDSAISRWFVEKQDDFPPLLLNAYEKVTDLAYGENPHQRAAYYAQAGGAHARALDGAPARRQGAVVQQRARPQLGAAADAGVRAAGVRDHQAQQPVRRRRRRVGARGLRRGVRVRPDVGLRRRHLRQPRDRRGVRRGAAEAVLRGHHRARRSPTRRSSCSSSKPNMRILEDGERRGVNVAERDIKRVMGGLLVQDRDMGLEDRTEMQVVTERKPTEAEWGEMLFAWKVCKHVRSNAIVLSNDLASVGVGAGQMSRVDSVRLAIEKAREAGSSLLGAALASDAFFPFSDGPQLAVDAGITAIIQPGGSKRDDDVVQAADAAGISMVLTHRRHFKH